MLNNMIAIITGGASGIGKATVELFISHGAKVLIVDIKENICEINNSNVHYLCLDVSRERSWKTISNYVKTTFSKVDILVNNAGISGISLGSQSPEKMLLSTWSQIHKVNLTSIFLGCKHIVKLMKHSQTECSIINIASRSGMVGVPSLAAYASSKASVINYTKSIALYCAEKNYKIRCNYIAPAAIYTSMWDNIIKSDDHKKQITKEIPLGRMGEPIDVAKAILYFATESSRFSTGSGLIIDGGVLAGCAAAPRTK